MAIEWETVSPIFIQANTAPVILLDNTFSENIGTTGGALHIISPNFELRRDPVTLNVTAWENNTLPLIYMNGNNFTKNMAYFSANAFAIIPSKRFYYDFLDYRSFCGAGIELSDNLFQFNNGMKRHNGGAGIISCKIIDTTENFYVENHLTSGHFLEQRYNLTDEEQVEYEENNHVYYYDPTYNTTNITDMLDPENLNYTIY